MPRTATGLRREHPFQLSFDDEEDMYGKLKSWETKKSRAELIRGAFFIGDWRSDYERLKKLKAKMPIELRRELAALEK
jgi:hypothetical protein